MLCKQVPGVLLFSLMFLGVPALADIPGEPSHVTPVITAPAITVPDQARQQQLLHLLRQDCGSCHGMTLQGGLGPDLLAPRMAGLPREYLITTIAKGHPGTPMPPWEGLLSAGEIAWLVDQLQQGASE